MSSKIKKEFICILHSEDEGCGSKGYNRECDLKTRSPYATATCPYRVEAVLAAAEKEESPVSGVQQGQPEKTADTMEKEITDIF